MKCDMRIEAHFFIIHKFSSLSVHECHLNEHGRGRGERGREGDWRLMERKRNTIRGGERPRGNERRRERRKGGGSEGGRGVGRSRGGYQSHRDESAFVRHFIISLYHSLDHHNTTAMPEEFSNAPPTRAQTHTSLPLSLPSCLPLSLPSCLPLSLPSSSLN